MAEKNNTQAQVKEILQRLDEGIKDLFTSEKYAEYLKALAKFPQYSFRNVLLIYMQKPDASHVCGYRRWQEKFGRHVKRGEKGIKILAPTPIVQKMEMQKIDPVTQEAVIGKDGLPVTEEVEIRIPRFRPVSVFDASQTDGKPLPELAENLTGDVRHYDLFLDTLKAVSPLPISFHPFPENRDGECEYGVAIRIREGLSQPQTICAILHEMAHARLHDPALIEPVPTKKSRNSQVMELEAESVAYSTSRFFGVETAPNSFGYIASWAKDHDRKELHASFDVIQKTVTQFIHAIDSKFHELAKERGVDLRITPGIPEHVDIAAPEPGEAVKETKWAADSILPDSSIGIIQRDSYGYTDPAILPMRQERALELYDQDHTIYLLYQDGAEAMAFAREEVEAHDGIFGIEATEWHESIEFRRMASENNEATKESIFLGDTEDAYAIYQIKDISSTSYAFLPFEQAGSAISCADYTLAYSASLPDNVDLEAIFFIHNSDDRPAAREMRSLSTSDVVVLRRDGEVTSNYVDTGGFTELPAFLGVETPSQAYSQPENMLESAPQTNSQFENTPENSDPSVAELEATVKSGGQISLMDLAKAVKNEPPKPTKERPSVLAKLREAKMKLAQGAGAAPPDQKRDTERGV